MIEKIAADELVKQFYEKNVERIQGMISAQQALMLAKKNFNDVASPLIAEVIKMIENYSSEFSEEGMKYFQEKLRETKVPFGEKK